ncbi:MAG: hypothetical protein ACOCVL_03905, partial [Candidatus Sumerlaeota bacterium]
VERPAGKQPRRKTGPRVHPIHPMDHFVAVEHKSGGLALFSEFPMNYELVSSQEPRLALTLLRAVGQLSRSEHTARGPNTAGPETPTPEAQCLGREFIYRFALRPFAPSESDVLMGEAMLWRERPVYGLTTDPRHARCPRRELGPDPVLMECDGAAPVLTALKRKQSGSDVVARFYNPLAETRAYRIRIRGAEKLQALGLNEQALDEKPIESDAEGYFQITIPAFGLASLEITPAAPWASIQ